MTEARRTAGVTTVRVTAGEQLPRDPRVLGVSLGEWFALIERPCDGDGFTRYGVARHDGRRVNIEWFGGATSRRHLEVEVALRNGWASSWSTERQVTA